MSLKLIVTAMAIVVTSRSFASWSTRFMKFEGQAGEGVVLYTQKVPSLVRCGSLCEASTCKGINVRGVKGDYICTSFASITNVTVDTTSSFYCAGCGWKGEPCTSDDQCTFLTDESHCDPTEGVCACVPWYMDEGPECVIRPVELGGLCVIDSQCLAMANYSLCAEGVCQCEDDLIQSGDRCRFDYAGAGFESYNGRWILSHTIPAIGITWNQGADFCQQNRARMMRPRSSSEWNWMQSKALGMFTLGFHLGITDAATEGTFVWADGSPAAGDPVIQWAAVTLNTFLTQCVGVDWFNIPFTPVAKYITCVMIYSYSVFCESIPELE